MCTNICRLREAIQSAADQASSSHNSSSSSTASDRDRGPSAKHLKPIVTAVEMVFGSAAALSATFGFKALPTNFPLCSCPLQQFCDNSTKPSCFELLRQNPKLACDCVYLVFESVCVCVCVCVCS